MKVFSHRRRGGALHRGRGWILCDRRARLEDVVAGSELVFPVRRLAPDGLEAWKQVLECGFEGYGAKDEASAYEGGQTRRWLKVKQKTGRLEKTGGSGGCLGKTGDGRGLLCASCSSACWCSGQPPLHSPRAI